MDSPFGPFLANAFLSYHEENWLTKCLQGFKPIFLPKLFPWYFDTLNSNDHLRHFQDFLNSCHIK